MLDRITPIILTYNEAPNIGYRLRELSWAADIVIVDSYSDDDTVNIVSSFPRVRLFQRRFDKHASQWNFALTETGILTDWILALDADYRLTDAFTEEIRTLTSRVEDIGGYQARFNYCIHGRQIRSGVYPAVVVLYQRKLAEYVQDGHTQRLAINGKVGTLNSQLFHDDRKPLADFLRTQYSYAKLEATKLLSLSQREVGVADRIRRHRVIAPLAVVLWCLIFRGGILDGWPGFYYAFQRGFA